MNQREFLTWAEGQEGRHEFDGLQPVAMTSGTNNHGAIATSTASFTCACEARRASR